MRRVLVLLLSIFLIAGLFVPSAFGQTPTPGPTPVTEPSETPLPEPSPSQGDGGSCEETLDLSTCFDALWVQVEAALDEHCGTPNPTHCVIKEAEIVCPPDYPDGCIRDQVDIANDAIFHSADEQCGSTDTLDCVLKQMDLVCPPDYPSGCVGYYLDVVFDAILHAADDQCDSTDTIDCVFKQIDLVCPPDYPGGCISYYIDVVGTAILHAADEQCGSTDTVDCVFKQIDLVCPPDYPGGCISYYIVTVGDVLLGVERQAIDAAEESLEAVCGGPVEDCVWKNYDEIVWPIFKTACPDYPGGCFFYYYDLIMNPVNEHCPGTINECLDYNVQRVESLATPLPTP